ncbi:MAG TPA: VC0807 family protein [Caulobacteraceae bacterium]|nr:VC0807 family protein [Caulobacteraceae bacterium]
MTAATDQPAVPAARPFRLTMLIPTLLVSVVLPIAIFKSLEALGAAPVWALAAGSGPIVLNNLRVWIQSRRLDPVGLLMLASIGSGVAASLILGDIGSRIVTDCLMGSAWGLGFLGSLLLGRPASFYLIRALVAGDDASRTQTWNGLWRYGVFRSTMRSITVGWGAIYFAQVFIEAGLARVLRADAVVTIAPILSTVGSLGLIVIARPAMQAMRKRLERVEHVAWPL